MNPCECHGCKWFYVRELNRGKDYMCSYSKYHQSGMKWGRLVSIKRKKTCNRKEFKTYNHESHIHQTAVGESYRSRYKKITIML